MRLGYFENDKSLISLFTEAQIRSQNILPLFKINKTLTIAVSDPLDSGPINSVRDITGLNVDTIIASATEIESAIDLHFGISSYIDMDSETNEATKIADYFDETRIVELVDSIILQSQKYSCSIFTSKRGKMIYVSDSGWEDCKIFRLCQRIYTQP